MGSLRSGRHPHYGGALKQVGMKFPTHSSWFQLAKQICKYRGISFNEFVRLLVVKEVKHIKYTQMWHCECTTTAGKFIYHFKRKQYCNNCGVYQLEVYEKMGRKSDLSLL